MVNDKEYELVQDDEIVAGTSGANAFNEIQNYAAQYGQDGPVEIYEVTRHKIGAAAAPKVVADEWALDWKDRLYAALDSRLSLYESLERDTDGQRMGLRDNDTQLGVEFAMRWFEQNMLASSAAAPVQAQEPFMFGIMGPDGKAHMDEHCVAPDAASLYDELNGLNDSPDTGYIIVPLYRAPVQPMAVPDEPTEAMLIAGGRDEIHCSTCGYDNGGGDPGATYRAMRAAAPAAQGDKK